MNYSKEQMLALQQDLINFQSYVAGKIPNGFDSEEVEQIQNTINLLDVIMAKSL